MEGVGPTLRARVMRCNLQFICNALCTRYRTRCTQQKNSAGRGEREKWFIVHSVAIRATYYCCCIIRQVEVEDLHLSEVLCLGILLIQIITPQPFSDV